MWRIRLSAPAEQDIENILEHSEANFGENARLRYEALLEAALYEISANPDRPAVRLRPELGPGIRTYHLFHARDRARTMNGVVKRPRHLLVFRISTPDILDIGRVLHDAMDLAEHLPAEYNKPSDPADG
jgi:toxin ParE1/3/4